MTTIMEVFCDGGFLKVLVFVSEKLCFNYFFCCICCKIEMVVSLFNGMIRNYE